MAVPGKAASRVFLTGASGFIGSHLLQEFLRVGCVVEALIRPETRMPNVPAAPGHLTILRGTLDDPESVGRGIARFEPDVVIHAAWRGVDSTARQDEGQPANAGRTLALADASVAAGVRRFLAFGSMAEYGPCAGHIAEDHPTVPHTRYGAAKLAALDGLRLRYGAGGRRLIWMRPFALYGPGEGRGWLIPDLIATLLSGQRPALSPGGQVRDYLHVADAAEAVVHMALREDIEGVFNLGSGQGVTIRRMAEMVRDRIDPKLTLGFGDRPYSTGEPDEIVANVERIRGITGWSPKTQLTDGLTETVEWYRLRARGSQP